MSKAKRQVLSEQVMKRINTASLLIALLALLAISGCGGPGYLLNTSPITVGVKASATAIDQSQQISLTATVTNAPANDASGVTWASPTCSAPSCGTLSNVSSTGATYNPPSPVSAMLTVTVTATSVADTTRSGSTTFIVAPNPTVSQSSVSAPAAIGSPYSVQLISGGTPPYVLQFSAAGSASAGSIPAMQFASPTSPAAASGGGCAGLPPWLSFNQNTGVLSATGGTIPDTATDFACALTVKDSVGITSAAVNVRIIVPMVITATSPLSQAEQTQAAYGAKLTAKGGPGSYSWTVLGSLPSGLSLNSGTGEISGTVGSTATTQKFTVQVTGSANDVAVTQDFTIAVAPRVTVTTPSSKDLTFAINTTPMLNLQTVAGTGVAPFHWTAVFPLPSWLTLSNSGVLSTAGVVPNSATTSQITVQVTDGFSLNTTAPLTITVPIIIDTSSLPDAEQLQSTYSGTLKAAGGSGIYSWSVDGSLPAGLSLNSNTGVISGSPATTATTQTFAIRVADSIGASESRQYTIAIKPQPAVISPSPANLIANIGNPYNLALQIAPGTGVTPFTWSVPTGSTPPPWLDVSSNGVLSASSAVPVTATTQSFTLQVKDGAGVVVTLPLTLTVPIVIAPASLPMADQAQSTYSVGLTAMGGSGTYSSWRVVGALPSGLFLNSGTGLLSGTLAVNAISQTFTVQVSDSLGATGSSPQYTLTVNPALVVGTTSLPNGAVNSPYTQTLSALGGLPPYSNWQVASGSLPKNVLLDSTTGILSSGTDLVECPGGAFNFSVTVQDSLNNTSAPQALSLKMTTTPLAITTTLIPNYSIGRPYSHQLQFTGGGCEATVTWSVASGSLPAWLTLSPSGLLSGTPGPNDSGSVPFEVQATDGLTTATQQLTLNFSAIFTVSGKISLVNGGGPLAGVTVSLGPNLTQTTGSDGNFSINTGNGTYTVTLSFTAPSSVFIPASSSITETNGTFTIEVNNSDLGNVNFNAALGFTVSGQLTYGGKIDPSKLNRVFIRLQPTNCSNCSILGTSAPSPNSKFSIKGVPPGTYTLQAWMDYLGYGIQNAFDPAGMSDQPVTVATQDVTNAAITITDPSIPGTLSRGPNPTASPIEQGVIVQYQPILDNNGVEQALAYNLQWVETLPNIDNSETCKTDPEGGIIIDPGSGNGAIIAGSGRTVILDSQNSASVIFSFPNPLFGYFLDTHTYSICMQGLAANPATGTFIAGPWSVVDPQVTVNPPIGGSGTNTVSGNVTIPDSTTPSGPLYAGCYDLKTGKIYGASIESPVTASAGINAYRVDGVPTGAACFMFAMVDQDNDGFITPVNPSTSLFNTSTLGDIYNTNAQNPPIVTITGNTTQDIDLTPYVNNSAATVTTQHTQVTENGNTQDSYDLVFNIRPLINLPIRATLLSGPNVVSPVDFALCTECGYQSEFNVSLSTNGVRPQVGDTYVLQVSYATDPQVPPDQLTVSVSAVLDAFPNALSPTGAAPNNTPTFSWTDPANAGSYMYQFALWDANGNPIWQIPSLNSFLPTFSSSITSVPWSSTSDPTGNPNPPSVSSLVSGSTYTWAVRALDNNGNSAQSQVNFIVP